MSEARPGPEADGGSGLVRGLSPFDATTIIVGSVIGSGIFFAPAIMAGYLQAPGLLLGLWILGGFLSLFGALSYGEMAAALPRAGGQYVFLSEAFSPLWGFLYGWTFLLAINTGLVAAVSVAFAKTLGFFLPGVSETTALLAAGRFTFSTAQAVALVVIAVITWLNVTGLRTGALVQNVFTVAKVMAVATIVVLAVSTGRGSTANFTPVLGLELGVEGVKIGLFAALAGAMSKALFAYDAWNSATFTAEEVKDPARTLPRALIAGTLGVTALYCSAVAVYLYMVPIGEMATVRESRIATEAVVRMIGPAGGAFIAIAILVSTFGCVNGLTLSGARVAFAMARDRLFFARTARVHPRFRTPAVALVFHGVVAALLTLTGTYSDLLTLTAFSSLLFNVLTIVGLFVLRVRQPDLPRPYRAWGYPVVPALYVLVSAFFLVYIPVAEPRNAGLGLGVTLVGLPFYLYWKRAKVMRGRVSRSLVACLGICLWASAAASPAAEPAFAREGEEAPLAGAPDVRETRFESGRPPGGSHDRIRVHRYRAGGTARAALLYLPGTNMNGQVALADEDHNLWIFLARRGVEVFTLDYRTAFVPSADRIDLGFMADWGVDAFAEDVRAAAALARRESGRDRLFVAGFSRGGFFAFAEACLEPEAVAGLVILDGAFKSHVEEKVDRAAETAKLRASGEWGVDVAGRLGWGNRQKLFEAVLANPAGPPTDPKAATIGEQATDLLQNAWGPGGLTNPRAGLARLDVLSRLLVGYDRYYPAIQTLEGRAIAAQADDPATRIDDRWGESSVPILYFGSTGMGADFLVNGIWSAARSGSKDVTLNVLERYGHLDVVIGEHARADVFEPTLAWMLARPGP